MRGQRAGHGCEGYAELRSGYLDQVLDGADRDRLLQHLARCPSCVAELAELRRIRTLLTTTRPVQDPPPAALAQRLVRIAGSDARRPLWTRPFRRTSAGRLPSAQATRRRRVAGTVAATAGLVVAVGATGYVAAPGVPATVADATVATRADFAAAVSQLPLSDDAVATVMMVRSPQLRSSAGVDTAPVPGGARTLTAGQALAALETADQVAGQLRYAGVQRVEVADGSGSLRALVDLSHVPGQGSALIVRSVAGTVITRASTPAEGTVRGAVSDVLALLGERYTLSGLEHVTLRGRQTTLIEARDAGGAVTARWWLDETTGLPLRYETYVDGVAQLAAGYTSIGIGGGAAKESSGAVDPGSPRLAVPRTTATLTLSAADNLSAAGWSCVDRLGTLTLVRLRSTAGAGTTPGVLHMVYSDGLTTVSVFERRGRLAALTSGTTPAGAVADPGTGGYTTTGFPRSSTWQSGDTVFTVVTDGSAAQLTAAVSSLPHRPPSGETTMERIQAGWARILQRTG